MVFIRTVASDVTGKSRVKRWTTLTVASSGRHVVRAAIWRNKSYVHINGSRQSVLECVGCLR